MPKTHPKDPLWIAAPASWRDLCFALPATRALADAGPVRVIFPERQRAFWEAGGFDAPLVLPDDAGPRAIAGRLAEVPRLLLWEDGPVATAAARAKVPERLGLPAHGLEKSLTHPIERTVRPGPAGHAVRRFLDVAEKLDAGPFRAEHFEPLTPPGPEGHLLLAPGSDFGRHFEWPLERWRELLESLPLERFTLRVTGEQAIARDLADALGLPAPGRIDHAELPQFGRFLGADASLPHLAAAFGATCAVLYGPDDPARVRPLGKRHLAIRRKVECSPCFAAACPLDLRCQHDLDVARVREKLAPLVAA